MKRILYFGYYIKQLNKDLFKKFAGFVKEKEGISGLSLWVRIFVNSLRYNISILEYFQFHFYKLTANEKENWAGTGFMYEYQLKMNPKNKREILDNKLLFYKSYSDFFVHKVWSFEDLTTYPQYLQELLEGSSGKFVLKTVDGKCGKGVEVLRSADFTPKSLIAYMKENGFDMAEEFVVQHPDLMALSPSAVNTVRVFTQLDHHNNVVILGCRQRISVNSPVDNMAAGNLAAVINEKTGVIEGPAVYSDITKQDCLVHPVTGVKIDGFQVPFWSEIMKMVQAAALMHPQNRSIGWDIVVTDKGPGLIEGNHDWCKLLWQLPVKKGMKKWLQSFEKNYVG